MEIEDSNKYGKLDITKLQAFESKIGSMLPEDYREFLINHNGGKPTPCDFVISKIEGSDSLHVFYGIHDGPSYSNLEEVNGIYRGRIPRSMITFADDPFGNALCIGINSNNLGKVFFWNHEMESDDGEEPSNENITFLAGSFNKFINSLYEFIDPNENKVDKILRKEDIGALKQLLESGYDIEKTNEYDRTLIEEAAIKGNNEMIKVLFERGASLRTALAIAENNAQYFDSHKSTVILIKELQCKV